MRLTEQYKLIIKPSKGLSTTQKGKSGAPGTEFSEI